MRKAKLLEELQKIATAEYCQLVKDLQATLNRTALASHASSSSATVTSITHPTPIALEKDAKMTEMEVSFLRHQVHFNMMTDGSALEPSVQSLSTKSRKAQCNDRKTGNAP